MGRAAGATTRVLSLRSAGPAPLGARPRSAPWARGAVAVPVVALLLTTPATHGAVRLAPRLVAAATSLSRAPGTPAGARPLDDTPP
jgi:hypothetical protein